MVSWWSLSLLTLAPDAFLGAQANSSGQGKMAGLQVDSVPVCAHGRAHLRPDGMWSRMVLPGPPRSETRGFQIWSAILQVLPGTWQSLTAKSE